MHLAGVDAGGLGAVSTANARGEGLHVMATTDQQICSSRWASTWTRRDEHAGQRDRYLNAREFAFVVPFGAGLAGRTLGSASWTARAARPDAPAGRRLFLWSALGWTAMGISLGLRPPRKPSVPRDATRAESRLDRRNTDQRRSLLLFGNRRVLVGT